MSAIIMFYDSKFPLDGPHPQESFFNSLGQNVTIVSADNLATILESKDASVFVYLHGSYFPKDAWDGIQQFLNKGKGLNHTGGAPFRNPCYREGNEWKIERTQTAYHQALKIHETLPVDTSRVKSLADSTELFNIEDTYNLIMHPTKSVTIENEMGSVGPMDATIYPLLKGVTNNEREIAAPSVLIEHAKGTFSGARWIFINQMLDQHFWNEQGAKLLKRLANFVEAGVTEFWSKTTYANYYPGERATIQLQHQALAQSEENWTFKLTVEKNEQEVFTLEENLDVIDLMQTKSFVIPEDVTPGFYDLRCELTSDNGETRTLHQGY